MSLFVLVRFSGIGLLSDNGIVLHQSRSSTPPLDSIVYRRVAFHG